MTKTKVKEHLVTEENFEPKRCVDCDSDCWYVHNHLKCWLGIGCDGNSQLALLMVFALFSQTKFQCHQNEECTFVEKCDIL